MQQLVFTARFLLKVSCSDTAESWSMTPCTRAEPAVDYLTIPWRPGRLQCGSHGPPSSERPGWARPAGTSESPMPARFRHCRRRRCGMPDVARGGARQSQPSLSLEPRRRGRRGLPCQAGAALHWQPGRWAGPFEGGAWEVANARCQRAFPRCECQCHPPTTTTTTCWQDPPGRRRGTVTPSPVPHRTWHWQDHWGPELRSWRD